jgi:hypothetical protein
MGHERRTDAEHTQRHDDDVDSAREHDEEHQAPEVAHAHTQARLQPRSDRYPIEDPERLFEGVGDQDALWTKLEAILDGSAPAVGLPAMVRDMDSAHRIQVKGQLDALAKVASGAELIVVAEIVGAPLRDGVAAALQCATPPGRAQVRSYLAMHDTDFIGRELDAPEIVDALARVFPGSPIGLLPGIVDMLHFDELRRWYFAQTPQELVARTMVRHPKVGEMAARLNAAGRGSWTWAFHVDDAMVAMAAVAVQDYATISNQDDVRAFLQRKVDAREAGIEHFDASTKTLERAVAGRTADADAAMGELARIEGLGVDTLRVPGNRRRFLAAASAAQIDEATALLNLPALERAQWLVDGPTVTLGELRDALASWPSAEREEAADAALIRAVRARWPAAGPADVFGIIPPTLYGSAARDLTVRQWIVQHAAPREILAMLVAFPNDIARRCAWMSSAGGGWGWLDQLGVGQDDVDLRRLMLRCEDPALATRIQAQFVGDVVPAESEMVRDAHRGPAPAANAEDKLARAVTYQRDGELAEAAGQLDEDQAARARGDAAEMKALLERTRGSSLTRVLYAVEPPLLALLQRKEVTDPDQVQRPQVAAWVRTRPAGEVVAALADTTAAANAQALWPHAPLEVIPQLRDPDTLAAVLRENPEVLDWIVAHSEPMSALHALGSGRVAAAAAAAFDENPHLIAWLPSGQLLSPRERSYLYSIAHHADGRTRQKLDARIGADANEIDTDDLDRSNRDASAAARIDVDERAVGDDRAARAALPLGDALQAMLDDRAPVEDIITVCRERAGEALKIVDRTSLLTQLISGSGLDLKTLFPDSSLAMWLRNANVRELLLDSVPTFAVLVEAAHDVELARHVCRSLNGGERVYLSLVRRLPAADALSPLEKVGVERIAEHVTSADAMRALFVARWGSGVTEDFDASETWRLWKAMARLPASHVEHGQVARFLETEMGPAGRYSPTDHTVEMDPGVSKNDKGMPLHDRDGKQDKTGVMSRAEFMALFEMSADVLDKQIADGKVVAEGDMVRMAPATQPDLFSAVALHEIGHAVDDRSGQTAFTNGLAGWRQFGDADFEAWATELGGWDKVTPDDQRAIRDAWRLWTNSNGSMGRPATTMMDFVGASHPAVAVRYQQVGVVAFARGEHGNPSNPYIAHGRAYLMNGSYQQLYSVPVTTMHSAPTAYAMTAPAEFFAECYMSYYLPYDGTPQTAAKKGELVAPWIKRYFDAHIDRLGEAPRRS